MKRIFIAIIVLIFTSGAYAQILTPVKWSYAAKKNTKGEAVVFIKATIDAGWHIYSQTVKEGGPVKTTITFSPSKQYMVIGKTTEPTPITKFEKSFGMNVSYFEKVVVFQQKIKLKQAQTIVKGKIEFETCNDKKCLAPEDVDFSIAIK